MAIKRLFARNTDDDVTDFDVGAVGRSVRGNARDDDLVVDFCGIEPEPGPRRPVGATGQD